MKDNSEKIKRTLKYLISTKNNDLLRKRINYYLINKEYVLKLLYIYKNKISYSTQEIKELKATSNDNSIFNINTYFICLKNYDKHTYTNDGISSFQQNDNNINLEGLNIIYEKDNRNKDVKLNEIKFVILFNKCPFNQTIDTIKNLELKNGMNKILSEIYNTTINKRIINNIMKKLFKLVKNNNINELDNYIVKNDINLRFVNSEYLTKTDRNLLKYSIDNNCSFEMLDYLMKKCTDKSYTIVESISPKYDNIRSLLYYTIAENKFKYSDFLLKKGAKINVNYNDDDYDTNNNILINLLRDNKMNMDNLNYILSHNLIITPNALWNLLWHNKKEFIQFILKDNNNITNIFYGKRIYKNFLMTKTDNQNYPLSLNLFNFLCNKDSRTNFLEYLFQDINDVEKIDYCYKEFFGEKYIKEDEEKKLLFIDNIRNGNLVISGVDNYFIDNLYHSDDIKNNILSYIKENQYDAFKSYIMNNHIHLTYFNNHDRNIDILIYALENKVSLDMIYLILKHYSSLNYYVSDSEKERYKTPLLSIFEIYNNLIKNNNNNNSNSYYEKKNKFEMIKLLLDNNADINYKAKGTDIVSFLCKSQLLCKEDLDFILDQGFMVTSDLIVLLIYYNKEIFLDTVLRHLLKKNPELIIKYDWLNEALSNNNPNIIKMLFKYGKMDQTTLSNSFDLHGLVLEAIEHNNYYFIDKLLSNENKIFNFNIFNFEDFFSKKYFRFLFETENKSVEIKHFKFMKYLIQKLLMHPLFDFDKISYSNVILNLYEIQKYYFIKCFIKYSINNKTLNFEKIDLVKILNTFCRDKNKYIQTKNIIKMLIIYSLNHETFTFKNNNFEEFFSLICQYYIDSEDPYDFKHYSIMNPLEFLCNHHNFYLIKLYISRSFNHETFNLKNVDVVDCLYTLHRIFNNTDSIPILTYFIEKMVNSMHYDISSINIPKLFSFIENNVQNNEFSKFVIDKLFLVNTTNLKINPILISKYIIFASKIKDASLFEYSVIVLFNNLTLLFSNNDIIEYILLGISKIDNYLYTKSIIEKIFIKNDNHINYSIINSEKILLSSIKSNNIYLFKWLFQKSFNNYNDIISNIMLFEKLLLLANRNNNINIMDVIIKQLLNINEISTIRDYNNDSDKLDSNYLSIIKLCDESFISLILNTLIRLHSFTIVKNLVEHDELKNHLNINTKDRNNDFPICIASEVTKEYAPALELFEYLLDHGANYNVYHSNHIPLFIFSIKTGNYLIIQNLLLKRNVSITQYIDENFYSMTSTTNINELDDNGYSILHYCIFKNDIDMIDILVKKGANVNYMKNKKLHGHSAIDMAISMKNENILSILLKSRNLLINQMNDRMETPLTTLLKMKCYTNNEKLLWIEKFIHLGANVNAGYYQYKKSPLLYAIENEDIQIVECLLKYNNNFIDEIIKKMIKYNRTDLLKGSVSDYLSSNKNSIIFNIFKKENKKSMKRKHHSMDNSSLDSENNNDHINDRGLNEDENRSNSDSENEDEMNDSENVNNYADLKNIYNYNQINKNIIDDEDNYLYKDNNIYKEENDNSNIEKECEIIKIIKYFIDSGMDINEKDKNGKTLLYYSVENNYTSVVKCLIELGSNVNILYNVERNNDNNKSYNTKNSKENNESILSKVLSKEIINDNIVKCLISAGVNIDDKNIITIIKKGHIKLLKWIFQQEIKIDHYYNAISQHIELFMDIFKNNDKLTTVIKDKLNIKDIFSALNNDDKVSVKIYVKYGGNLSHTIGYSLYCNNKYEKVKYFIKNGANVNELDDDGHAPLYHAIYKNDYCKFDIIKYLIDHGAKIISQSEELEIIDMIEAIKQNDTNRINYLFDNHSDNIKNNNYWNDVLLHYAIESRNIDVVKCLIKNGAVLNKNYNNKWNDNHLNRAIMHSSTDIIKYIIDISEDINDNRPLIEAMKAGKNSIVKYLLINKGFNIKSCEKNMECDSIYYSPIYHAIMFSSVKMLKYLHEHGAYIHDSVYCSPPLLETAIDYRKINSIKYLINKGANIYDTDGYHNNTPFDKAKHTNNEDLINYLLDHQYNKESNE